MTTAMDGNAAQEYALSLAREHKEEHVDVVFSRSEDLRVMVREGKVEKVDQSTSMGMGVRVLRDGRTGLAFTERLAPDAIDHAFAQARENCGYIDPTEVVMVDQPLDVPPAENLALYNPALDDLPLEELVRAGQEMERRAHAADSRVKSVPYAMVGRTQHEYTLANSHGVRHTQRANSCGAYCMALLEEGGQLKSGRQAWMRREWDAEAAAATSTQAVGKAAALLGARAIHSEKLPVVFTDEVAPQLLGMFLGSFYGEAAQKGRSRLKGRLGQQIAGTDIQLYDDPHMPGALGSCFVDDEGTPTARIPLIEDGRFANFLYHVQSARKDGASSTGHATRSISGGIGTGFHNIVLPLGTHGMDALCAMAPRALLVTELEGGAGCNPVSGDISIGVQGQLLEGGRRVQPVDSVTIAGNFFELLNNIRAIGDSYQPNLSNRFIPALLVDGLSISG